MKFHLLEPARLDWRLLDDFEDRTVFQTREWLDFIAATQGATPVVAELRDGGALLGYFSGLRFRRWGLRILGSPFPGWTTPYIGFNLRPGVDRGRVLRALEELVFGELGCLYMEVSDRRFEPADAEGLGFTCGAYDHYETDLDRGEEELFAGLSRSARWSVRKAERNGIRVEEADDERFAPEYYHQLEEVYGKQGLVPTYPIERVEQLIRHLMPTGRLLLLRARDADGRCVATGIFAGMNRVAQFWGGASYRESQRLRPNEALLWHAMLWWKRRGIQVFDWGGGIGGYKQKYGVVPVSTPSFRKSPYPLVASLRRQAKRAFWIRQRVRGRLAARSRGPIGRAESAIRPGPAQARMRGRADARPRKLSARTDRSG